jgi:hypothetical protein
MPRHSNPKRMLDYECEEAWDRKPTMYWKGYNHCIFLYIIKSGFLIVILKVSQRLLS